MATVSPSEVPHPCIATEPGGLEQRCCLPHPIEPVSVEVRRLVQVDVEKVVGGWLPAPDPGPGMAVEALGELDPNLQESSPARVGVAQRLRVERARCITGAVLRAHPETESGQSRHAVEEAHAVSRADVVSRASPDVVWVPKAVHDAPRSRQTRPSHPPQPTPHGSAQWLDQRGSLLARDPT